MTENADKTVSWTKPVLVLSWVDDGDHYDAQCLDGLITLHVHPVPQLNNDYVWSVNSGKYIGRTATKLAAQLEAEKCVRELLSLATTTLRLPLATERHIPLEEFRHPRRSGLT